MNPSDTGKPDLDEQYATLLKLWFGISMSVLMCLVVIQFVPAEAAENRLLTLVLNSLGVVPVALSFLIKQRMLAKSVTTQQLDLVKSAYILSFALSESSALLGFVDRFVTGSRYYYFAFAIAGLAMILHFPQKRHLANAASCKQL